MLGQAHGAQSPSPRAANTSGTLYATGGGRRKQVRFCRPADPATARRRRTRGGPLRPGSDSSPRTARRRENAFGAVHGQARTRRAAHRAGTGRRSMSRRTGRTVVDARPTKELHLGLDPAGTRDAETHRMHDRVLEERGLRPGLIHCTKQDAEWTRGRPQQPVERGALAPASSRCSPGPEPVDTAR